MSWCLEVSMSVYEHISVNGFRNIHLAFTSAGVIERYYKYLK